MWRDCSACGGEIEPVICFNGAVSISGCAPLRSFPQVYRNKPRRIAVKKRCDIFEKLPTNILGCRHLVPEREGIFVHKAMVVAIVNDFTGALLNFADVDQHSGGRIGLTRKNKVGHIVAAGAVTRGAFFAEKFAVLFCGKFLCEQPTRGGEFDAFADGEKHDAANATTRNRANDAWKLGILPDSAAGLPAWRNANSTGKMPVIRDRAPKPIFRYSFRSERNSERVRASSLKVPRRHEVFMTEFCFSTPRIIMQRCFASTTTATPEGCKQFMSDSAIWVVRFSWICKRRANTSTIRATLERPITFPFGRYATCARPMKGSRWCSHRE